MEVKNKPAITVETNRDIINVSHSEVAIQNKIILLRGVYVMLDSDLAELYHIENKQLKRQVRRNLSRFPSDFMFELSQKEHNDLIMNMVCQKGTSVSKTGGNKYPPFAFTELGVAMLSSVLKSEIAVQINVAIMRAFSAMKAYITQQNRRDSEIESLKARIDLLKNEREQDLENMNDLSESIRADIDNIYQAIADLSVKNETHKSTPTTRIGFKRSDEQ